jgi:phosphoesterase RecJ-like protein
MIESLVQEFQALKGKTVGVISHVRPDADCIGSQVALCRWLDKAGVKAIAFNDDDINPNLQWITDYFAVKKPTVKAFRSCDAFVLVDGNHPGRFGRSGEMAEASKKDLYLIDHHPQPADIFKVQVSDVKASSTAELVYRLYAKFRDYLDVQSAEAMYAGIMTDTGSFRFDSVTAGTHAAVADLIETTGLETEPIHRRIYDGKKLNQMQLLASVLGTIQLHEGDRIASLVVTKKMLAMHKSEYHDLEGMVNYGLGISGVMASVLFCEMSGKVKLSLRSASDIDVNVWARQFNGGGHIKAAGAWYEGNIQDALKEVIAEGAKQLKD